MKNQDQINESQEKINDILAEHGMTFDQLLNNDANETQKLLLSLSEENYMKL